MLKYLKTLINYKILLLCVIAFINGLFYIFIIPPWQKPDEPGHFEYIWLIANYKKIPEVGEFNWNLRRELVSSMIENEFFNANVHPSSLLSIYSPPSIITPQVNNRPFYYLIISIFLHLVKGTDIVFQLYVARLISLLMFLSTILISQRLITEVLGKSDILTLIIPLSMALHPSFVDIMTAVNDDVGATLLFSIFLYVCILIIKRGLTKKLLFYAVIITLFCFFTKDTVLLTIPILLITILISVPGTLLNNKLSFFFSCSIIIVACFLLFRWGDAKSWLRTSTTVQSTPTSIKYHNAPHGQYVLKLFVSNEKPLPKVIQFAKTTSPDDLSFYTIGSFIWSEEENLLITPFTILIDGKEKIPISLVQISNKENFFLMSFQAPSNRYLRVEINPLDKQPDKNISIYYDGIFLIEGILSGNSIPIYIRNGKEIIWEGKYYKNIFENSSFESRIPYLNPNLSYKIWKETRYIYSPNLIISSLFDLKNTGWYYISTIRQLNSTFWAKFGWGHVTLKEFLLPRPYFIFGLLSITGILGFLLQLVFSKKDFSQTQNKMTILMLLSASALWLITFFRGITSLEGVVFIPGARYAFPVIIPTTYILCTGWYFLLKVLRNRNVDLVFAVIMVTWFIIINMYSVISILDFYHY